MSIRKELFRAVDAFETAIGESHDLGDKDFNAKRMRGVELRRVITSKRSEIGELGEQLFANSVGLETFRIEFGKMRSAMAEHHASWPLVGIDLEDAAFVASSNRSREAARRFIGWIRQVLAEQPL